MGTGCFPGVKRPRLGVYQPPPSSPEVKERTGVYIYSPSRPLPIHFNITRTVNDVYILRKCLFFMEKQTSSLNTNNSIRDTYRYEPQEQDSASHAENVQCTSCIVKSGGSETQAFGLANSLTGSSASWWNLHRGGQRRITSPNGTSERPV
jgi:hypothetical protein